MTTRLNTSLLRRSLLALAATLCVGHSAFAQSSPIVIKFSHVVAIDTPKGKAAEFFAKRASELTKGPPLSG